MRYLELDALRGIAALAVVLFHFTSRYFDFFPQTEMPAFKFMDGGYGVNLFFVISGFVISFSAQSKNNALSFLKGRIIRLYPLYWVSLTITFTLLFIFPLTGLTVDGLTFLVNFTMFQKFIGFDNVDGAYWTLAIEWLFYGIIIAMLLVKSFSKIYLFVWFMIVANIALVAANFILEQPIVLPSKLALIFDSMAYFACGVSFYLYKKLQKNLYIATAFFVILLNHLHAIEGILILDLVILVTFLLFTTDNLKWLAVKPLVYLGNLSYALYLIHQNVGYIIIYHTIEQLGPNLSIVLAIISMMALAHIINVLTDKFITPLVKKTLSFI